MPATPLSDSAMNTPNPTEALYRLSCELERENSRLKEREARFETAGRAEKLALARALQLFGGGRQPRECL